MIPLFVALFGLVVGSFLNVCIARLPRHESIVTPRSRCPRCGHLIRGYDNIPLVSYVLLRARCRDCKAPISPIYPLVELLTAAILVADLLEYGLGLTFVKWSIFGLLMIVLIFTDLYDRRIPHTVTLPGMAIGLALSFFIPVDRGPLAWMLASWHIYPSSMTSSVLGALLGAILGGGLFYVTGELFYLIRHVEGLGFGDVMLMGMAGLYLGAPLTLLTILLGSLFGTVLALPLHFGTKRFRNYAWPYGSFLGVAAIFASLGGQALIAAYLHWSGIR